MNEITAGYCSDDVCRMLAKISEKIKENVDLLAHLDGLSGDGDLGETMGKSADAMIEAAAACDKDADIGLLLMKVAMAMNKAAPSTLGTLLSCAVMAVAKKTKGRTMLYPADVIAIPGIMASEIQERGGASLGDKTILDALIPMSEAVLAEFDKWSYEEDERLKSAYHSGALAARQGADNTASMIPKAGRAQWIGERVRDNLDGGAVLCAIVSELFLLRH